MSCIEQKASHPNSQKWVTSRPPYPCPGPGHLNDAGTAAIVALTINPTNEIKIEIIIQGICSLNCHQRPLKGSASTV